MFYLFAMISNRFENICSWQVFMPDFLLFVHGLTIPLYYSDYIDALVFDSATEFH